MKILHVLDHSIPLHSGYTFRTRAIIQCQRAMGWKTEHLTSGKQGVSGVELEEVDGLRFYRTSSNSGFLETLPILGQFFIVWKLYRRALALIDLLTPDLVHAHSPALNGLAARWACRQRKIPLVYECRAFWEDAAVDNGSTRQGDFRYRLSRALETHIFNKADAVTTICEGLKRDVIARGIDAEKITVIPNAVDLEKFTEEGNGDSSAVWASFQDQIPDIKQRTILGFFGSFYEYEGLSMLLDTMALLKSRGEKVLLILAGGGPKQQQIIRKIEDLKLADIVTYAGRVDHNVIQDYYHIVDLMIYPRLSMRLTELVTPLKPLEAMAKGKIVIASGVGGHQELINNGVTGLLFEPGSSESLARTIVNAIRNRDQWQVIRRQARRYVEEDRNWERSVSFYRAAYGIASDQ